MLSEDFCTPNISFDEYLQLGSRRNIRPIKNGLKERDMMPGMAGIWVPSNETENKNGNLENDIFLDWQPVKCFEKWSKVFVRKTTFAVWF